MEVTPPKIIEKGEVPTSRSNTGVAKMAVMGVLAGMILCAGVIVIRTIMDDTIKSEEDIEKYLGLSTLSVIPDRKDYINGSGKKLKLHIQMRRQKRQCPAVIIRHLSFGWS